MVGMRIGKAPSRSNLRGVFALQAVTYPGSSETDIDWNFLKGRLLCRGIVPVINLEEVGHVYV